MKYEIDKITDFEFLVTVSQKRKKYYRVFLYSYQKEIRFWGQSEREKVDSLDSFIRALPINN